ncbi:MAG: hypothetical protein NT070_06855 [Cyanobacteria bacterium]|nr:hypothetical protein [Cyanobacteriota bacterium]
MKKTPSLLAAICLILVGSLVYAPTASPQVGKVIFRSLDELLRFASKKVPGVANRTYKIISTTKEGVDNYLLTVQFANTIYPIHIDCKKRLGSSNLADIPKVERTSLIKGICTGKLQ